LRLDRRLGADNSHLSNGRLLARFDPKQSSDIASAFGRLRATPNSSCRAEARWAIGG
jgi:hypothetical protein